MFVSYLENCWEFKFNLQFKIRIQSCRDINSVSDISILNGIIYEAKTEIRFIADSSSR
jgi:hypothetical protein